MTLMYTPIIMITDHLLLLHKFPIIINIISPLNKSENPDQKIAWLNRPSFFCLIFIPLREDENAAGGEQKRISLELK